MKALRTFPPSPLGPHGTKAFWRTRGGGGKATVWLVVAETVVFGGTVAAVFALWVLSWASTVPF